jgi:hypothetical protein
VATGSAPGDVLYRRPRGRAIWFPGQFTLPGGVLHTLSNYHRNLVFASLQIESLGGLVMHAARELDRTSSSEPYSDCVRHAAVLLGGLYSGAKWTYRTASAPAQIVDNGWIADINKVRDYFCLLPLSALDR